MHSKSILKYEISQWIPLGQSHSIRSTLRDRQAVDIYHTHEYAELTYISTGSVLHKTDKTSTMLGSESLLLVRPEHHHSVTPKSDQTKIINIAFTPVLLEAIGKKYFGSSINFWAMPECPTEISLDQDKSKQFQHLLQSFSNEPALMFYLEKFMLNFLSLCGIEPQQIPGQQIPLWLSKAVEGMRQPEHFVKGLSWFYHHCSRSPNHVARYCRKYYGKTPGQLLQRARLEYAAKLLASSDHPIDFIAYEVGYNDLSHFYRHFKSMFNQTPAGFRSDNSPT